MVATITIETIDYVTNIPLSVSTVISALNNNCFNNSTLILHKQKAYLIAELQDYCQLDINDIQVLKASLVFYEIDTHAEVDFKVEMAP